jgi:hypothetical protein
MQAFDTSVIVRTRRKLSRCPELRVTSGRYWLRVDRPADDGFPIFLRVHARHFSVHLGGWSRRFDRDDDAMDCVEFGLSSSCRLLVEYRGSVEVAWTVEAREFGTWQPHHRTARWLVPFWCRKRTAYLQNRIMLQPRSNELQETGVDNAGDDTLRVGDWIDG